jgi:hypothetical protein
VKGRLRGRLTYSNVVATIALCLALGGGVAIGASLVGSKQVANNSLKSKDLKNNKAVTGKDVKDSSLKPTDLSPVDPIHVIGAPGEPAFGTGGDGDCIWQSGAALTGLDFERPAFYKDRDERIHLSGLAAASGGALGDAACDSDVVGEALQDFHIFTLPPGYRPDAVHLFENNAGQVVIAGNGDAQFATGILPAGAVIADGLASSAILDGVSFRAAPAVAAAPDAKQTAQPGAAKALRRALGGDSVLLR